MRATLVVVAAIAAACGRIGFDAPVFDGHLVVEPLYPGAPAWNDWIQNSRPELAPWRQTGSPCAGDEPGFTGCLHGGELRRVETPYSTCACLELSDTYGLQWTCVDDDGGAALVSTGLRPSVGLRHLVLADGWKLGHVTLSCNGAVVATSEAQAWWSNPIVPVPANDGTGVAELGAPGTIYTAVGATVTDGYAITADRVALVVLPASLLMRSTAGANCDPSTGEIDAVERCVVFSGSQRFVWVEGDVDARDLSDYGVLLAATRFARVRGVRVGSALLGITVRDSSAIGITDVVSADNEDYGLELMASTDVVVSAITTTGNGRVPNFGFAGVLVTVGSTDNTLTRIVSTDNDPYGVLTYENSVRNTIAHATVASNGYAGIGLRSPNNAIAQIVTVNHPTGHGIQRVDPGRIAAVSASRNNIGIRCEIPGTASSFAHVGANAVNDCELLDGTSFSTSCVDLSPGVVVVSGLDLATSFRGAVTEDDIANDSDSAGAGTRATIGDWIRFDNPARGWGSNGAFPGTARPCTTECRIWDWRRAPADRSLAALDAAGERSDEPLVPGAPCPARLDGDHVAYDTSGGAFLVHAFELLGDGRGDEDGLCERAETCLDAPSLGADRDEPLTWSATGCGFRDGIVDAVDVRAIDRPL